MVTTINVNGKPVEIELTTAQVEQIKKASLKITDRVKTLQDALIINGTDPEEFEAKCADMDDDEVAYKEMKEITKALNEGWEADYNNGNQKKWYPWFKVASGSGFGFSDTYYRWATTSAYCGARLCFKTEELAEYAGKTFTDIYKRFHL